MQFYKNTHSEAADFGGKVINLDGEKKERTFFSSVGSWMIPGWVQDPFTAQRNGAELLTTKKKRGGMK